MFLVYVPTVLDLDLLQVEVVDQVDNLQVSIGNKTILKNVKTMYIVLDLDLLQVEIVDKVDNLQVSRAQYNYSIKIIRL